MQALFVSEFKTKLIHCGIKHSYQSLCKYLENKCMKKLSTELYDMTIYLVHNHMDECFKLEMRFFHYYNSSSKKIDLDDFVGLLTFYSTTIPKSNDLLQQYNSGAINADNFQIIVTHLMTNTSKYLKELSKDKMLVAMLCDDKIQSALTQIKELILPKEIKSDMRNIYEEYIESTSYKVTPILQAEVNRLREENKKLCSENSKNRNSSDEVVQNYGNASALEDESAQVISGNSLANDQIDLE